MGKVGGLDSKLYTPTPRLGGGFYSPEEVLSKFLRDAMEKANELNPVRLYPERTGEIANLSDSAANLRSVAAIFVKKYRFVSSSIAIYYATLRKRELTPNECSDIVSCVSCMGTEDKTRAMLEWLKVLESGGEDAQLRNRESGDDEELSEVDSGES